VTNYIGIDQSYSGLAFVVIDVDGNLVGENLAKFEPKKHGSGIDRLLDIYTHILSLLYRYGDISQIVMEGYSAASKFGREQAGELGAIVKLAIREHFDPDDPTGYPTIIQPTSVKKFTTGSGATKKSGMMLAVYKKWGYSTTDDNLADAYALARIARALDIGTEFAYEADALKVVKPHTERVPAPIAT
jgi:Holliday junction resolvasome RuvABC endonuclease subunit